MNAEQIARVAHEETETIIALRADDLLKPAGVLESGTSPGGHEITVMIVDTPTTKQHIDAAIVRANALRAEALTGDVAREFSLAITALEDAKMRLTRGLAKHAGIFNEVDLEQDAGLERARENHAANVAGNSDGGIARS